MKYVLLIVFLCLTAASFATWQMLPQNAANAPVLYWVTDFNPARIEQVRLFREWLKKNGHPDMELRLDTSNSDDTKKVIQGVSGVGGDVIDVREGAMRYYHAVGILEDVTESAGQLRFDPSKTWPVLEGEITVERPDGQRRQYTFPCNTFSQMYFVNRAALRRFDQPDPPTRWNADEFERLGKAFVAAANPAGSRRKFFYADTVDFNVLRRSFGVDVFNETMTACALDDPRHVAALKLYHKWTYVDRIIPSRADADSFATDAGYGGQGPQLFNTGNYAMLFTGRHLVIQFREFNKARKGRGEPLLDMMLVEPPYVEFLNTGLQTRAASVYAGGAHKDLAAYFLSFLASEDYNMQVVRDGDALPPNPAFCDTEAFERPPDHPEEWAVHEPFAEAARAFAIPGSYSPFVLQSAWKRIDDIAREEFMNDRATAEDAAKNAARRINDEIARTLREDPSLLPAYEQLTALQKQIDGKKSRGEKVPDAWIKNPFHLAYYRAKGLLS